MESDKPYKQENTQSKRDQKIKKKHVKNIILKTV